MLHLSETLSEHALILGQASISNRPVNPLEPVNEEREVAKALIIEEQLREQTGIKDLNLGSFARSLVFQDPIEVRLESLSKGKFQSKQLTSEKIEAITVAAILLLRVTDREGMHPSLWLQKRTGLADACEGLF